MFQKRWHGFPKADTREPVCACFDNLKVAGSWQCHTTHERRALNRATPGRQQSTQSRLLIVLLYGWTLGRVKVQLSQGPKSVFGLQTEQSSIERGGTHRKGRDFGFDKTTTSLQIGPLLKLYAR